jgi:hypothetical protein
MYKYSIRQSGIRVAHPFGVGIDFLKGMYSGWLLSSIYAISEERNNVMEQLYDGGFGLYLISLIRVDSVKSELIPHQVLDIDSRSIAYFNPDVISDAFAKPVVSPLSFCWSLPLVYEVGDINPMLLPYHIVPNFSKQYVSLEDTNYLRDMIVKHTDLTRDTDMETLESVLFSKPIDEDLCRYGIGSTITGTEAYLLKVPLRVKLEEFLQGLLSLYITHYQDTKHRGVHTYDMPKLYMYDYGSEVLLKPSKNKKTLTVPILVTPIAFN